MTNLEAAKKVSDKLRDILPYAGRKLVGVEGIDGVWLPILVALDAGLLIPGNIPWDQRDDRGRFLPRPKQPF